MSWQELTKLREQLNTELGDDDDDLDPGDDNDEWIEADLIDALAALHEIEETAPAVKKGAPKSPPKGYPSDKSKYADPTNYKYPLETEAHVRAALSYFSKPANRSKGGYSPEEQKFMWKRIIAAAKKFGIELSDDVKKHAEALGNSNSDCVEVKETLNEKEILGLIDKAVKEQMKPTGQAPNTMESYTPQVRVPPDIEAINTQLENFKQMHAKHEAANKDMSAKLDALQKQVSAMNEAFMKMQQDAEDGGDDDDDDSDDDDGDDSDNGNGKATEAKAAKGAKGGKAAPSSKAAPSGKSDKDDEGAQDEDDADDDDTDDDDSDGDSQEEKVQPPKHNKKVKEQFQKAQAEGLVATSDMANGTGVSPPGFAVEDQDQSPRSFGDAMNRATRLRRRTIGGN